MRASARSVWGLACSAALAVTVGACGATIDSLGYNDTESKTLLPLTPPASYPNPFRDLLGQTDAAISAKLNNAFNTIFHGSPSYAIYVPVGVDQAYIEDTYHDDEIRTEGIGLGMMICVEFNKEDEFDKLWRYARDVVQNHGGPDAGYFPSFCDTASGTATTSCLDPYGFEQFVTALIFANDRWGSAGAIDYASDALALFHTLRHKEDDNGGVVGGVTNMFDATTNLPLDVPNVAAAGVTRPSLIMPGITPSGPRPTPIRSGPRRPSAADRSCRLTPTRRPGSCRCAPTSTGRRSQVGPASSPSATAPRSTW